MPTLNLRTFLSGDRRPRAFTLIEMLVVVGVIGLLLGLLAPSISKIRRTADDAASAVAMRNVFGALLLYSNDYELAFPYWGIPGDRNGPYELDGHDVTGFPGAGHFGNQAFTWANMITPYMSADPNLSPLRYRLFEHALNSDIFACRFKMTFTAFADPRFWSDREFPTDAMLRGTRMTEMKWPSRKGILIDIGNHLAVDAGIETIAVTVAAGDGSVGARPFVSVGGIVDRPGFGGRPTPFDATRDGLAGIDF